MVKGGSVEAVEFPQASTDPKQKVKTLNIWLLTSQLWIDEI